MLWVILGVQVIIFVCLGILIVGLGSVVSGYNTHSELVKALIAYLERNKND